MTPEQQSALEALRAAHGGTALTPTQVAAIGVAVDAGNMIAAAEALSEGLATYRQPHMIGEGTISDTLGLPAGPIFVQALIEAAESPLPADPTIEQRAQSAMIRQAWRLLSRGNLDVGLPSVRAGIMALVGVLPISQADADKVCAIAREPVRIGFLEVADALEAAQ